VCHILLTLRRKITSLCDGRLLSPLLRLHIGCKEMFALTSHGKRMTPGKLKAFADCEDVSLSSAKADVVHGCVLLILRIAIHRRPSSDGKRIERIRLRADAVTTGSTCCVGLCCATGPYLRGRGLRVHPPPRNYDEKNLIRLPVHLFHISVQWSFNVDQFMQTYES